MRPWPAARHRGGLGNLRASGVLTPVIGIDLNLHAYVTRNKSRSPFLPPALWRLALVRRMYNRPQYWREAQWSDLSGSNGGVIDPEDRKILLNTILVRIL